MSNADASSTYTIDITDYLDPNFIPTAPQTPQSDRLSYEDRLYLWCLLLKGRLVGKLSPTTTSGEGSRAPVVYDLLVPATTAVQELNAVSDTPITVQHLTAILKHFRHLEPPYSSTPEHLRKTPKKRGRRSWKERQLIRAN